MRYTLLISWLIVVPPFLVACADAMPTEGPPTTPPSRGTQPSIDAVYSWVASIPGGRPLRPLFEHLPTDSSVIARLDRAMDAAVLIEPAEHLMVNDRGRYLSVRYSDGSRLVIRQVARCEPWSDADAKESVGRRCRGRWVHANDTWWVEDMGIVKSSELNRWWQDMAELMAPIGSIGIPKTIEAGEPFKITLWGWDDVVNGDSVNLSLVSLDGAEVGLGTFPAEDLFQGEVTVPAQTPIGRYWLRVAGGGFSELVEIIEVVGDKSANVSTWIVKGGVILGHGKGGPDVGNAWGADPPSASISCSDVYTALV